MTVVNRAFTYDSEIRVNPKDLSLAQDGLKTATVRLGNLSVANKTTFLTDGKRRIRIRVLSVEQGKLYKNLTDSDARRDGLNTREELQNDLVRCYGEIDPAQPMTVIHFRISRRSK